MDIHYRILIVDNELLNMDSLKDNSVSNIRFHFFTSCDYKNVVDLAISLSPDLIMLNWILPGFDGISSVKKLKENLITTNIPVIIISDQELSQEDLQIAFDAGAIDNICKPFRISKLRVSIKTIMNMTRHFEKISNPFPFMDKYSHELTVQKYKMLEIELEQLRNKLLNYSKQILKYNEMNRRMVADVLSLSDKLGNNGVTDVCRIINKYTLGAYKLNWNEFEKLFDTVNNRFFSYLSSDFPSLTTNEKKLCAYYRMNLSTKEISTLTYSSHGAVRQARNRLRKKIGIPSSVSLSTFLQIY